jgi:alpha-beta hydrolase superfamily lysophospholipase
MIAKHDMLSTSSPPQLTRRLVLLSGAATLLAGCMGELAPPGPRVDATRVQEDAFVLSDRARLPYRTWLPEGPPDTAILALHGFNDSRDAWELSAPAFAAAGIAFYAPDQRGFGRSPGRGLWPGADALADDAAEMAGLVRRRHPSARLVLMGESMGGAVLLHMATSRTPPPADYVLLAPAVWGRARMNVALRSSLWLAANLLPAYEVSRAPASVRVIPSDNQDALRSLSRNPLTIKGTRFDTLRGLVDLMDLAFAAAPRFRMPALFLYGAHDDLVPKVATRTVWAGLPGPGVYRGYYRNGYHLLFRDLGRAVPIADTIGWIAAPRSPLPSGADKAAAAWLSGLA